MGRQLNGKVYCNDGWTESIADYDFMVLCQNYKFSCNTSEWNNLSSKYGLEELFSKMQELLIHLHLIKPSIIFLKINMTKLLHLQKENVLLSELIESVNRTMKKCNRISIIIR